MTQIPWEQGDWLNPPPALRHDDGHLIVTASEGSDLWRTTSYGFIRDTGHALLVDLPDGSAVEVSFVLDFEQQFDQAGVLVRADAEEWIKAGVEVSDGAPQVGAVVTHRMSDWSVSPVPEWRGREVTIRVSRDGDALAVRARTDGHWQLVRLASIDPARGWRAGPYCCAPTRGGLHVRFTGFAVGPADDSLHG